MHRAKLAELDIVRGLAIIAVLVIHVTSHPITYIPWGSQSSPFYFMVNTLSMFAVPVFILLSGIVLFYRYGESWNRDEAVQFVRKRLQYIAVPYLVWSMIYALFYQILIKGETVIDFSAFFTAYFSKLAWGHNGYHLYFMVIIAQFYVFFPLLMTITKKLAWRGKQLIALGIVIQTAFYCIHQYVEPIPHKATLMPNYMIVFCVGGAIGLHYKRLLELRSRLPWVLATAVDVGYTYIVLILSAKSGVHSWAPFYTILYIMYAVLIAISMIWIGRLAIDSKHRVTEWLLSLGSASFGVYLIHPFFLSLWRKYVAVMPPHPFYHALQALVFAIVLALSWIAVTYLRKWSFSWLLFGKSGDGRKALKQQ